MNRFSTFFTRSIHLFLIFKMLLVDLNCRSVPSGLFWVLKTANTGGENLLGGIFHWSFGPWCMLSSNSLLISLCFLQSTVWIRRTVNSALCMYIRYNFFMYYWLNVANGLNEKKKKPSGFEVLQTLLSLYHSLHFFLFNAIPFWIPPSLYILQEKIIGSSKVTGVVIFRNQKSAVWWEWVSRHAKDPAKIHLKSSSENSMEWALILE